MKSKLVVSYVIPAKQTLVVHENTDIIWDIPQGVKMYKHDTFNQVNFVNNYDAPLKVFGYILLKRSASIFVDLHNQLKQLQKV